MELKHKECFTPCTINYFELQAVSKYAREAFEFVNLYSVSRGANRFPALIQTLERTANRAEVIERGFKVMDIAILKKWVSEEKVPGNPALEKYLEDNKENEMLQLTLGLAPKYKMKLWDLENHLVMEPDADKKIEIIEEMILLEYKHFQKRQKNANFKQFVKNYFYKTVKEGFDLNQSVQDSIRKIWENDND